MKDKRNVCFKYSPQIGKKCHITRLLVISLLTIDQDTGDVVLVKS